MLPKNFPYRKKLKREAGELRQIEYDKLTPAQKLQKLDDIFGPGKGAKRQRERLKKLLPQELKEWVNSPAGTKWSQDAAQGAAKLKAELEQKLAVPATKKISGKKSRKS